MGTEAEVVTGKVASGWAGRVWSRGGEEEAGHDFSGCRTFSPSQGLRGLATAEGFIVVLALSALVEDCGACVAILCAAW